MDCDGVLTDGCIWLGYEGEWVRRFHMRDGHGIKELIRCGVKVGIVTGSQSKDIQLRAKMLGIKDLYQGVIDKLKAYNQFKEEYGLQDSEISYIGDDEIDLPVLKACGFSVAPQDAHELVKKSVDLVLQEPGGQACVRTLCDLILKNSNHK